MGKGLLLAGEGKMVEGKILLIPDGFVGLERFQKNKIH